MAKEEKKLEKDSGKTLDERDEELDITNAITKAQDILRKIIGNLSAHQFKLEKVDKNGLSTRYIIISSVVPDLGQERDCYFIKIDVETGNLVPPMGKGKLVNGRFMFTQMEIQPEWEE